jgi:hypothetical protein
MQMKFFIKQLLSSFYFIKITFLLLAWKLRKTLLKIYKCQVISNLSILLRKIQNTENQPLKKTDTGFS